MTICTVQDHIDHARRAVKQPDGDLLTMADLKEGIMALAKGVERIHQDLSAEDHDRAADEPVGYSNEVQAAVLEEWATPQREPGTGTFLKRQRPNDQRQWVLHHEDDGVTAMHLQMGNVRVTPQHSWEHDHFHDGTVVMPLSEHERLMDLMRSIIKDNDKVLEQVVAERDRLLEASDHRQMLEQQVGDLQRAMRDNDRRLSEIKAVVDREAQL